MRRANTIRRFLPIGVRAPTFRKRWARSKAMKPFRILWHRSNTPLVLVFLSVAEVLAGCHRESQLASQSPMAVRIATVAASQSSGEALHYHTSILHLDQLVL